MDIKSRFSGVYGPSHVRRYVFLLLVTMAILGLFKFSTERLALMYDDGKDASSIDIFDVVNGAADNIYVQAPADACHSFPDTSKVLLVMKTGASEAYAKIPTQLMTNLRCVSEFLIFSDMKQTLGSQDIFDSLDTVLPSAREKNPDFDLYRRQQHCLVDQESCNKPHSKTASAGWALDKYKNIHMAEKAYRKRPNHDWYLFVDADTYVVWSTLLPWLARLDPTNQHYIGSPAALKGFVFGHGGSGYLLSQATMRTVFYNKDAGNNWDMQVHEYCCGDYMFARAIYNETEMSVENAWPTINGEKPNTLRFGDRQWCEPIATMHHIGVEEIFDVHQFDQNRNTTSPLRIRDLYHAFVRHKLTELRLEWDNFSNDKKYENDTVSGVPKEQLEPLTKHERKAHESFEDCRETCRHDASCLQFRYRRGECSTGEGITHGQPADMEDDARDRWTSGWDLARIRVWTAQADDCGDIVWPDIMDGRHG